MTVGKEHKGVGRGEGGRRSGEEGGEGGGVMSVSKITLDVSLSLQLKFSSCVFYSAVGVLWRTRLWAYCGVHGCGRTIA